MLAQQEALGLGTSETKKLLVALRRMIAGPHNGDPALEGARVLSLQDPTRTIACRRRRHYEARR